ncbi:MAG: glutathione synthase [Gammaproteobacteria bacterium]|nr:glutathione synthase [Gammaproteobacteria bacterium]
MSPSSPQKTRLGVVMDPIEDITPVKDTTLAFLLEAQRRDWEIHYFTLADLYIRDGAARGRSRPLKVRDDLDDWFTLGTGADIALGELDVIMMRKDPPFDLEYVYATYFLEKAQAAGTLVVNPPQALRDHNEKLTIQRFPECCAPTLVTRSANRIREFLGEHGHIVVKPLDGMGGAQVFVLEQGDINTSMILETVTENESRQVMAQKYIPEISKGDKRILVIDGEPYPYALARIPKSGESRGNLAAGGRGESVALSERDYWICEQLKSFIHERGLLFVGLDVIGDYLTEVNITSPTCVRELDRANNDNISARLFDAIEERLQ